MEIMDKLQEMIGRTFSPIEMFKLQKILETVPEDVVLEACMMSINKERPMDYMFKVLYYAMNPYAERPVKDKKEDKRKEQQKALEEDEWLKGFYERQKKEEEERKKI